MKLVPTPRSKSPGSRRTLCIGLFIALVAMISLLTNKQLWTTSAQDTTPTAIVATDCALDSTFGVGGRVTTDFPGGHDEAHAVVVQPDGKILVAGIAGFSKNDLAVIRLNPDSTLDLTFGTGGRVYAELDLSAIERVRVALQTDGKIIAMGSTYTDPNNFSSLDFVLARLNANGTLDTTFGTGGKVITDFAGKVDAASAIALQPDGKIIIAGGTGATSAASTDIFDSEPDLAIARYNSNGSLDTSFNGTGKVTADLGSTGEEALGVALQSDGKIIVAGFNVLARYTTIGTLDAQFTPLIEARTVALQTDGKIVTAGRFNNDFAIARHNATGTPDSSFDGDGRAITNFGFTSDIAQSVAIQSDGKIMALGATQATAGDFALFRVNSDGSPDNSFDGDGKVTTAVPPLVPSNVPNQLRARTLTLQADGRPLVVGSTQTGVSGDFLIARYTTNGSLDSTFDGNGLLNPEMFYLDDVVLGLGIQSTGKIVAGGGSTFRLVISNEVDQDFKLARYNTNGQLDATFGTAGQVKTDFGGASLDVARDMVLLPDDRILLVGWTLNHPQNFQAQEILGQRDLALARYTTNGQPDNTFGINGLVKTDLSGFAEEATSAVILPDGKIMVLGKSSNVAFLIRYNTDGAIDNSFAGGRVNLPVLGTAIALQTDGKILVGGSVAGTSPDPEDFAIVRVNSNGSLDDGSGTDSTPADTFGTNGITKINFASSELDEVLTIVVQPDFRIVAGGSNSIARFNSNGTPDNSFDGDGKATPAMEIESLALQCDGRIVAGGDSGNFDGFVLGRFNTDGTLDNTNCAGGLIKTNFGRPPIEEAHAVVIQPDGKVILGGVGTAREADFALARYILPATTATGTVQFTSSLFTVTESCAPATVTVSLSGPATAPVSVDYIVIEGTAKQKSDFTYVAGTVIPMASGPTSAVAGGRLVFQTGETTKDITVLITEDGFAEGTENLSVVLSNPVNASLGCPATTTLKIIDNDSVNSSTNPIDDPNIYVCQLYHDFLHRQPDTAGHSFWVNQITQCGSNQACVAERRHNVGAAFFLSIEFQQTAFFIYRSYESSLNRRPQYVELIRDLNAIGQGVEVGVGDWATKLDAQRRTFVNMLVQRAEFATLFPGGMTGDQFANKLFENAGVTPTTAERQAVSSAYGSGNIDGRVNAVIAGTDAASLYNHLYNSGFVLIEYFGFLRRDPDASPDTNLDGYNFWLSKMNNFTLPGEDARQEGTAFGRIRRSEMIRAFLISGEYRSRFGTP
jgi:uncharacterized delta-60 repeat protein